MGKPAARLGDPTAHGGVIVVGFPMVMIGGMPAARIGDMHVCPMLNPGVPPPPHVGGPIVGPVPPMVLIGGMPVARLGDMVVCAGPPDSIIMGCPTVMIGEAGGGSASGGGASAGAANNLVVDDTQALAAKLAQIINTVDSSVKSVIDKVIDSAKSTTESAIDSMIDFVMSAVKSATSGAANAFSNNTESSTKEGHWIEFEFVDKAGTPVSDVKYELTHPDQQQTQGSLSSDGIVRRDAQQSGQGTVKLLNLFDAKWSKEISKVGEKIKLTTQSDGFKDGTKAIIKIYRKEINGAEKNVKTFESTVKGNKVELEVENNFEPPDSENSTNFPSAALGYYFECLVEQNKAISDLLYIEDFIELELKDADGNPVPNAEYLLFLPNGKVESGKLDSNGYKKIEKIPAGKYSVKFPNLVKSTPISL